MNFEPQDTGEPIILSLTLLICTAIISFIMIMSVNKITNTIKAERENFIKQLDTELKP